MHRRHLLAVAGSVTLFDTAGCATNACSPSETDAVDPPPTAWLRPRYGPTNAGAPTSGKRRPTERAPPDDPATAWTYDVPDDGVTSAPVVADGTVYVATGLPDRSRQERTDGSLFAIDPETGTENWSSVLPKGATGPPTIAGNQVVVGARDGILRGFDTDGKLQWRIGFDSAPNTPAVVGDMAYLTTVNGTVRAAELGSSDACWTHSQMRPRDHLGFGRTYFSEAKPAVTDGVVYAATATSSSSEGRDIQHSRLLAIDAETGERRWQYWFDADEPPRTPAVRDGVVYVAGGDALHAVNVASGERRWSFATGYRTSSAPAIADGTVYCSSKNVYALDAETGDEQWRHVNEAISGTRNHDDVTALTNAPTVVGNTVYVAFGALDAETGEKEWGEFGNRTDSEYYYLTDRDAAAAGGPALADGAAFVTATYGTVHRFGDA
ncbi:PQQ-binding-like beta-propeller repeat protein [Halorussus sp. MSC15.2]|uniref:outer membrane protein assembly factor BamB family protein n=1 Tax=Halorussus sp. MSC15.2 TaxID=2283638 RepID=UPI0013D17661|nr:PQQ-binding-like beta-propeller repeat protein [Halorussus sp. MSC15.2]NEU58834.1 PQQ-binding-like beta-propeller repeat protein [Halorussus sp. MSC15.2]